jgi:hypothetical protein
METGREKEKRRSLQTNLGTQKQMGTQKETARCLR